MDSIIVLCKAMDACVGNYYFNRLGERFRGISDVLDLCRKYRPNRRTSNGGWVLLDMN